MWLNAQSCLRKPAETLELRQRPWLATSFLPAACFLLLSLHFHPAPPQPSLTPAKRLLPQDFTVTCYPSVQTVLLCKEEPCCSKGLSCPTGVREALHMQQAAHESCTPQVCATVYVPKSPPLGHAGKAHANRHPFCTHGPQNTGPSIPGVGQNLALKAALIYMPRAPPASLHSHRITKLCF